MKCINHCLNKIRETKNEWWHSKYPQTLRPNQDERCTGMVTIFSDTRRSAHVGFRVSWRIPLTKNYLAQNVNSAKAEKICSLPLAQNKDLTEVRPHWVKSAVTFCVWYWAIIGSAHTGLLMGPQHAERTGPDQQTAVLHVWLVLFRL